MKKLFDLTYESLIFLSRLTGFTYKEINIIVWFIIIPFSWAFLLDKIKSKHYYKVSFSILIIITLIFISDFSEFSNKLFNISVNFLRSFDTIGSNYTVSSVIVCLLVPLIIYVVLIRKAYFKRKTI